MSLSGREHGGKRMYHYSCHFVWLLECLQVSSNPGHRHGLLHYWPWRPHSLGVWFA